MIDKDFLDEMSTKFGINAVFLEKDLYVTNVLKNFSENLLPSQKVIFTGGTCLSKAYGIIKRFSEDIDFNIILESGATKGKKKEIRNFINDCIDKSKLFTNIEKQVFDGGNKVSFNLSYNSIYPKHGSLRDDVKVEFVLTDEEKDHQLKPLTTLSDTLLNISENSFSFPSVNPYLSYVDKILALSWRIYKERENVCGTTLRHLYDLHALKDIYNIDKNTVHDIVTKFEEKDRNRVSSGLDFSEIAQETFSLLEGNELFKNNYEKFVGNMVYDGDSVVSYEQALSSFEDIVKYIALTHEDLLR